MNTIGNWVANLAGVQKIWTAMDGKKTYAAAGFGILTSLAGLAVQVAPILSAHNTMGLWGFVQQLPNDPSWLTLVASFGLLGLGHKADKAAAATAAASAPQP